MRNKCRYICSVLSRGKGLTSFFALQVLKNTEERVIHETDDLEPSQIHPLGLYLVRGDNVCSVGLIDEKLDDSINWTEVKGSEIGGIKHI
jgi:U6 snRNA-associated Sm-like protein LSm8